ncbi:MAG: 6-carboxytetrahydropterin synthase QueD [Planctomycetota bacterium]
MDIFKTFHLESAHRLPNVPAGHKCANVHGHHYRIEVHVSGPIDPHTGWVMDFADIKAAFAPLHAQLDHHYLNDIAGLENPTAENIARWIWKQLATSLPLLSRIVVFETDDCGAVCTAADV